MRDSLSKLALAVTLILGAFVMMRTTTAADPAPGDPAPSDRTIVAADPVKVAPDIFKVAFENEYTRVLQVSLRPESKASTFYLPGHLLMATDPGTLKMTDANGNSRDFELKVGDLSWHDAGAHSIENAGHTGTKFIIIEYKNAQPRENTAGYRDDAAREPAPAPARP